MDQSSTAAQRFPFARLVLYLSAASHEFLVVHAFGLKLSLDKGGALGGEWGVGMFEVCAEAAGGESVGGDVGEVVPGGDVLVALFLAGGEFLHDGLFADVDCLVAVDLLEDVLLLVDHAVEDHLQVLVVLVVLLLYVLDRPADAHHLVVLRPHPVELALHAALEVLRLEQELCEVERLFFFDLLVVLVVFVLLLEGQHLVLLQEGLALPLKLLEVLEERLVDLLYSVHHHYHEDVIGTHARTHHFVDVLGHAGECFLENFPVFSGHADADAKLAPPVRSLLLLLLCLAHAHLVDQGRLRGDWFFEQGDVVVQIIAAELFERGEIVGYGSEGREAIFVVVDAIVLEHEHESFGEGVGRNGLIVAVGAEGDFEGLHEGDVEEVFGFDLGHEVADHLAFLRIANHIWGINLLEGRRGLAGLAGAAHLQSIKVILQEEILIVTNPHPSIIRKIINIYGMQTATLTNSFVQSIHRLFGRSFIFIMLILGKAFQYQQNDLFMQDNQAYTFCGCLCGGV